MKDGALAVDHRAAARGFERNRLSYFRSLAGEIVRGATVEFVGQVEDLCVCNLRPADYLRRSCGVDATSVEPAPTEI